MPRSLLAAILLIVAAPLAILGWFSVRSLRSESIMARQQLESVFQQRLHESQQPLSDVFDRYQRHLTETLSDGATNRLQALRELERSDPIVRSCLLIQANGQMVHPMEPLTNQPRDLNNYAALASLATNRPASRERDESSSVSQSSLPNLSFAPMWQSWFMNQGMQLVLWFPQPDGSVAGVLLERSRWMADIIAALPQTQSLDSEYSSSRQTIAGYTTLDDEQQRTIYRWGAAPAGELSVLSQIDCIAPLSSWKIRYHGNVQSMLPAQASSAILWSSIASTTVLLALGAYVLSSMRRQMKLAEDQVSFAGHVSHELRTPLTNIRLYADLAKRDVADLNDPSLQQSLGARLDVISQESERLGGLVSGVLDFMRGDQGPRRITRTELIPDELLAEIIESFVPSFAAAGIVVDRQLNAGEPIKIDGDILRIVIVNLLGNVGKYAASGGCVMIQSKLNRKNNQLEIRIRDHGPGIAPRHRRYVFKPFTRLSHAINAPSGTGIGLSIALAAAKRHQGNLTIESCSPPGCCFLLTIPFDEIDADQTGDIV